MLVSCPKSERSNISLFGFQTYFIPNRNWNRTEGSCLKSEHVRISDVHCTVHTHSKCLKSKLVLNLNICEIQTQSSIFRHILKKKCETELFGNQRVFECLKSILQQSPEIGRFAGLVFSMFGFQTFRVRKFGSKHSKSPKNKHSVRSKQDKWDKTS